MVGCQQSICKALGSRFGSSAGEIKTNGTELQYPGEAGNGLKGQLWPFSADRGTRTERGKID